MKRGANSHLNQQEPFFFDKKLHSSRKRSPVSPPPPSPLPFSASLLAILVEVSALPDNHKNCIKREKTTKKTNKLIISKPLPPVSPPSPCQPALPAASYLVCSPPLGRCQYCSWTFSKILSFWKHVTINRHIVLIPCQSLPQKTA